MQHYEFLIDAQSIVFAGGPGKGESHLANAIAVQAIQHHRHQVRFFSTIELVNQLEKQKPIGQQGKLANNLVNVDLVTLDELAYLPLSQTAAALLFHLIGKLYEKTSLIITTHLTLQNGLPFLEVQIMTMALLDRVTHHCHIIETGNDSYRFKQSATKKI